MSDNLSIITQRIKKKEKTLLIFDYDGTLTPIQDRPELAKMDLQLCSALEELAKLSFVKIYIVTGRKIDDFKKVSRLDTLNIIVFGMHGGEVERNSKITREACNNKTLKTLKDFISDLEDKCKSLKDIIIEDKKCSVVMHYRLAKKTSADKAIKYFSELTNKYNINNLFKIQKGKKVLEFLPLQFTKSNALQTIIKSNKDYLPFYFGDDIADISAFKEVAKHGGYAVGIKPLPFKNKDIVHFKVTQNVLEKYLINLSNKYFTSLDIKPQGDIAHWYKDAIIYEVPVKSFFDINNDGIGDFLGFIEKLDYLHDLGIDTIWLLPFCDSPLKDDGYDISDFYSIHPNYGTLKDFKKFLRECKKRKIKVIIELVVNHVSDQHQWFQEAIKKKKRTKYWNYFIWSDDPKKFKDTRIIFNDTETSNWAWQSDVKKFYWHRFFSFQPDLNHNNPQVEKSINKIIKHWADMGVDGFRLDAIPYLCVREGTNNENLEETHQVIKNWRKFLDANFKNKMFLAEANQWPDDVAKYFGDGDECHMAYNFPLMPRLFIAIRKESRKPIIEIMENLPTIPENCQWALFLRNHDELTLEMVTDEERDYMYTEYAKDSKMRLNLGIRRRLAPLVDNSQSIMELLKSILFSFPGSPVLYYGDEINMGDNIYLGDRNGVRTPMQWSPDRNAGFSHALPQQLYLPLIMDSVYGYQSTNLERSISEPYSFYHFMKKIIAIRKKYKAFGRGTIKFLKPHNLKILAYIREYKEEQILCIVNLARTAEFFELSLDEFEGKELIEIFGKNVFPKTHHHKYVFIMQPYSFFWFQIK